MPQLAISPRLLGAAKIKRCQIGTCKAACCLHGVWMDIHEQQLILANKALIRPFMKTKFIGYSRWFENKIEDDPFLPSGKAVHSVVVKDPCHYRGCACIFLNDDDLCALQIAAEAKQLHPWHFKPFYCILHPLDLTEDGQITLDETQELLSEPASCLRHADRRIPFLETFRRELNYILGEERYQTLLQRKKIIESSK